MSNRYDLVMEHLRVTPEMRSRVLDGVTNLSPAPARRSSAPVRWLAAAACVAVVAGGALYLHFPERPADPPRGGSVAVVNPIVPVDSLNALTDAVGFPVSDRVELPFPVEQLTYQVYQGEMAQLYFEGQDQDAVFRKCPGTQPRSGDYTDYESLSSLTVEGMEVTVKENPGGPALAEWTDGSYAYSLRLSVSPEDTAWPDMISALIDTPHA